MEKNDVDFGLKSTESNIVFQQSDDNSAFENLQESVKKILNGFLKELGDDIDDINHHVSISFDDEINNVSNLAKYKDEDVYMDILEKLRIVANDESVEASIRSKANRVGETIRISRESYLLSHPEKMTALQKAKFNGDAIHDKGIKSAFKVVRHGLLPQKKLSLEELKELVDLTITTQKEAGMYHCAGNPRAEEEYYKHEMNRMAKMNDNGLCAMLRRDAKNLKDPNRRANTVKELQYAGFDHYSNVSDDYREKYASVDIAQKNSDAKNDPEVFIKPTVEEVRAYATEKGKPDFDAEKYVKYNDDRQWKDKKGMEFHDWKKNVDFWIMNQEKAVERNIQKSNEGKRAFSNTADKAAEYEVPSFEEFKSHVKELGYIGESVYHKLNAENWHIQYEGKSEPIKNWKEYLNHLNNSYKERFEPDGVLSKEGFEMMVKEKGLNHLSAADYKSVIENTAPEKGNTDYYSVLKKKNIENVKKEEQEQSHSSGMKMQ